MRGLPWQAQVEFMNYRFAKWTIFLVLSLTAPAMLFLVMAVMFMPAIFFVAGIGYVIPKAFVPGYTTEKLKDQNIPEIIAFRRQPKPAERRASRNIEIWRNRQQR